MYSVFFVVLAAYFQGIEARRIKVRGGSVGVGGGGSNFITYLSIIGIVIMLMGFMVCLISRYCCGKDQEEEDDDAYSKEYEINRNNPTSTEQLDLHMLKLILLAEQAKNISNLHAYGQQHGEQSTADVQIEPREQIGSPQLILYTSRQMTSYEANTTDENPMISDIRSGPHEQIGLSRLKFDTNRSTTLYDANTSITEETPMISDIQSGPWEQMRLSRLKLDANRPTTFNDANNREKTQITSCV